MTEQVRATVFLAFLEAFIRFARWRAATALLLICLGVAFESMGLLLLIPIVGLFASASGKPAGRFATSLAELLNNTDPTARLAMLLVGFLLLMAIRSSVLVLRDRVANALHSDWSEAIRAILIARIARADWTQLSRIPRARIVQVLAVECTQVSVATNATLTASAAFVMFLGQSIVAALLAPLAGLLLLTSLVIAVLATRPFLRRAHAFGRTITQAHLRMTDRAMQFLDGLKLAVAEGQQAQFADQYAQSAALAMHDRVANLGAQSELRNLSTMLSAVVATVALYVGAVAFKLSPPILVALLVVLGRLSAAALVVQQAVQQIFNGLPSYAAILSLERDLATAPRAREPRTRHVSAQPSDSIILTQVTYRHSGAAHGLDEVDITIPAGAFVGVEGPSGSGKTSFLDLVAGIIAPERGTVSVHGRDVAPCSASDDRRAIAYVGQDPVIFDGSVRDNLTWSSPEATDADLWRALRIAAVDDWVRRAGGGLDTCVGARGIMMSAGERQRLALARAIARRPRLLILDEATNAIDITTEAAILDAMADMPHRPTILMAAHRIESFRRCDFKVTFSGGGRAVSFGQQCAED